jgi:hypothetical protein
MPLDGLGRRITGDREPQAPSMSAPTRQVVNGYFFFISRPPQQHRFSTPIWRMVSAAG